MKTIDYNLHPALHTHLIQHHSTETNAFDAIIDISGSDPVLFDKSPAYLKPGGTFILAGNMNLTHSTGVGILGVLSFVLNTRLKTSWPLFLGGTPRRGLMFSGNVNQVGMRKVAKLVEDGKLRPLVDSEWAMEDAVKAYEYVGKRRGKGKVVVRVQDV